MFRTIAVLVAVFVVSATSTRAESTGCATDKRLVDACFLVRGRLSVYADMGLYLWPVGSHRIFATFWKGVDDSYPPLPAAIKAIFDKYGIDDPEIFGDYVVCPYTSDTPGKMCFVCLDSATHLRTEFRSRRPEN